MANRSHFPANTGGASLPATAVCVAGRSARLPRHLTIAGLAAALLLVAAMVIWQLAASPVWAGSAQIIHVVERGETLSSIAERYGVSTGTILRANELGNPNLIHSGLRLVIPVPEEMLTYDTYVVARGDTLIQIAEKYGTTVAELMRLNALPTATSIYVDQLLQVPVVRLPNGEIAGDPALQPAAPSLTASTAPIITRTVEPAASAEQTFIRIDSPNRDEAVTSPLTVTGYGSSFEGYLLVRVLDATGEEIGSGRGPVDAEAGAYGAFSSTITMTMPLNGQLGRVQVFSINPRDGGLEQLNSQSIFLRGLGLDAAVSAVKAGLESGELESLAPFMASANFSIGSYLALDQTLRSATAMERLRRLFDQAADVQVDLTVDGQTLLRPFNFGENVLWVAYSTGWGMDGQDDAFLVFRDIDNRAVWAGLLYVVDELKPY